MPPPARLAIAGPPQVTPSREVVPYRPRQLSRRAEGNLSMDRKKEQLFNQRLSFQPYYKYKPQANTYFKYLPDDDDLMSNEDDDEDTDTPTTGFDAYYAEDVFEKGIAKSSTHNKTIQPLDFNFEHTQIKPWLSTSLNDVLQDLQVAQPDKSLRSLAITYSSVSLDNIKANNSRGWTFHEFFGFLRE